MCRKVKLNPVYVVLKVEWPSMHKDWRISRRPQSGLCTCHAHKYLDFTAFFTLRLIFALKVKIYVQSISHLGYFSIFPRTAPLLTASGFYLWGELCTFIIRSVLEHFLRQYNVPQSPISGSEIAVAHWVMEVSCCGKHLLSVENAVISDTHVRMADWAFWISFFLWGFTFNKFSIRVCFSVCQSWASWYLSGL